MRTLTRLLFLAFAGCWAMGAIAADGPEDLRRAAEAGDVVAQFELGTLYEYGFHMPDNEAPALAWYTLAAEQGHAKAAERRDALRARMQPATVEQAAALAAQWRSAKPQAVPAAVVDAPAAGTAETAAPPAAETTSDAPASAADTDAVLANFPAERVGGNATGLTNVTEPGTGASP